MSNMPADSQGGAAGQVASRVGEERSERELLAAILAELQALRVERNDERAFGVLIQGSE